MMVREKKNGSSIEAFRKLLKALCAILNTEVLGILNAPMQCGKAPSL
jgi:hypothetical protein